MATYTRNSRILKKYHTTPARYGSFGPVNMKPKRVKITSYFAKCDNYKLISFMLHANK